MGMQCWGRHWPDASDGSLARQTDSGLPLSLVRRGTEDAVPLTPARPLAAPTLFPGPSYLMCDSMVRRALWPPDALLRDLDKGSHTYSKSPLRHYPTGASFP